jgi:hypothetical protein
MRSPYCLCLWNTHLINFWVSEPIFLKLGMYIISAESISTAYFINPSHLCLYVYPTIIAGELLGKHVTAATNTQATIQELLETSFSMRFLSYERKLGDWFFLEVLILNKLKLKLLWHNLILNLTRGFRENIKRGRVDSLDVNHKIYGVNRETQWNKERKREVINKLLFQDAPPDVLLVRWSCCRGAAWGRIG